MRLAYVSLHWPRTRNSGVGKKIQSQVAAWNEMGHEARLFLHSAHQEPVSDLIEAEYFFYPVSGKLGTEFHRILAVRRMLSAIRDFAPDLIYLRYGIYVYPVHQLMKIAPVVEEINTNDLTQHEGLGRLYSLYNSWTRGILLRSVHGLIPVSDELAETPAFASYQKPSCVIANGVNLSKFPLLPPAKNHVPHLVFIGSPGYPWHGVDKIVDLARRIPDVNIGVVGYHGLPELEPLPENIKLHGYLDVNQYQKVLAAADVAISSLALHRVGLEEASPLKSRECLAFGLPMIIAYKDTDLEDSGGDFLLRIPNKEDNIKTHADAIREFAYKMQGKRVERRFIQALDQHNKEDKRLRFFESLLNSR
ncbi:MAG: glycosyltransferase family 4 protein [Anaerolineales bacterium]|jgi:hypothetical protein|nr:glycosyltransferase family 4 protein [Anaerolineales bacterium]